MIYLMFGYTALSSFWLSVGLMAVIWDKPYLILLAAPCTLIFTLLAMYQASRLDKFLGILRKHTHHHGNTTVGREFTYQVRELEDKHEQ